MRRFDEIFRNCREKVGDLRRFIRFNQPMKVIVKSIIITRKLIRTKDIETNTSSKSTNTNGLKKQEKSLSCDSAGLLQKFYNKIS